MFINLSIDDIEIRLLEKVHAEPLFALIEQNRAHLRPWLKWVDDTTGVGPVAEFIAISNTRHSKRKGMDAGIWFAGELVGAIGLYDVDWQAHSAHIGYWLAAPHQGKGIMTRCCAGLINFCFTQLDLNRVQIRCDPTNAPSRAIPQRLGFTCEGTLRPAACLYGRYVDQIVFGLLRSEWTRS